MPRQEVWGGGTELGRETRGPGPGLPAPGCVALAQLLHFSGPRFLLSDSHGAFIPGRLGEQDVKGKSYYKPGVTLGGVGRATTPHQVYRSQGVHTSPLSSGDSTPFYR